MTNWLSIYNKNNQGDPIFTLDPSKVTIEDQKSIESLDIPGQIWNEHFDSSIVSAKWTISGKFKATDSDWDDENFEGRPFEFMHKLRSVLKSINSSTGDYVDTQEEFCLRMNYVLASGTYTVNLADESAAYSYSSQKIYFIPNNSSLTYRAGSPLIVDYTLVFIEVSDVMRL